MKLILKGLLLLAALAAVQSVHWVAEARFHHGAAWGNGFYAPNWQRGYWFHGAYGGRDGWWWVIGPNWYYYPSPYYPYPPAGAQPVYIVQVPNAPPPPAAPAPGSELKTSATPSAPPPTNQANSSPGGGSLPSPAESGAAQKATAFTYYCEKTKGYYPTTSTCDGGWVASHVKGPN